MRMYKLLLVTDQKEVAALFRSRIDWPRLNCRPPQIVETAEDAIALLNSAAVDAVGFRMDTAAAAPLKRFLRYGRPSLPVFAVYDSLEKQLPALQEMKTVLDRLHADFIDDYYDEDAMLTMLRDEVTHSMLAGEFKDWSSLKRGLSLIRARLSLDAPGLLYEIDMPQGEIYLSEHHGHAQERLECALRNNFFGRYVDGIYYAVGVLTPRHIRLACIPMANDVPEDSEIFAARVDEHVQRSIQRIKEYLDLDLSVVNVTWLNGLKDLIA